MSLPSRTSPVHTRWLMVTLMVGVFLSPLNVSFTSIALPTMRDFFSVNVEQATWIGTAYLIPSVTFMPLQASLGERWGVRKVYVTGLLLLAAGGLLAAVAPDFQWLLASRVLQGIGWSALYPLALVLIRMFFPATRQGAMMGIWESAVGAATILSPLAGGVIVDFFGWTWLYLVLGVVAGLGALLAVVVIPGHSLAPAALQGDFDWRGALSFTLALGLALLGVVRRTPFPVAAALLAWIFWWRTQRRARAPFISARLLTNRVFLSASLAANLRMVVAIAALTALPLFFEDVQGLRPSVVGSLMIIYSVFLLVGAWPGGLWADRSGARAPGTAGFIAMVLGSILLLGFDLRLNLALVALALALRGIGAGLAQTPFAKAATEAAPGDQAGLAAGLYGTIRYSGLALGTALVGILLQQRLTHYGALAGGPGALPAYRELWLALVFLSALGLVVTFFVGSPGPLKPGPAARGPHERDFPVKPADPLPDTARNWPERP